MEEEESESESENYSNSTAQITPVVDFEQAVKDVQTYIDSLNTQDSFYYYLQLP